MANNHDKDRILNAAREKQLVMYKGTPIRPSFDFSTKTLQSRREQCNIFSDKKKNSITKNTLPGKDNIQIETEIKSFTDKQKLKESGTTKLTLQEMLK